MWGAVQLSDTGILLTCVVIFLVIAVFADASGLNYEASGSSTKRTLQEKFSEADNFLDFVIAIITVVVDTAWNVLTFRYPVNFMVKVLLVAPLLVAFLAAIKGTLGSIGAILALVGA